ncbi:hypothetical protein J14TS2_39270 [Bacillus sp. J14TS2]|uniref:DUF2663 family protein n=1 Tax=Bacillus sp. J14TS2 TaxID=2807188 RepID=UPI001B1AA92B|nr:DUF2663 family protein [Bacillus sp. J14TS2]GIN73452.1 hypothetical protein J14TS2_39270 [Bacillus sp. J14TS2]
MESFLLEEGDKMDPTTKRILQNLIDRKLKLNRFKQLHFILFSSAILFSTILFYSVYNMAVLPYRSSVFDLITFVLQQNHFIFLLLLAFGLFGTVKIVFEKREKSEQDFHALRREVIDKSGDLWKGEQWGERHKIYEQMKKKYDINLYHQSK